MRRPGKDTQKKTAIYKLRREASEETNCTNTLFMDFLPPELWENKFLLFQSPRLHLVFCDGSLSKLTQIGRRRFLQSWRLKNWERGTCSWFRCFRGKAMRLALQGKQGGAGVSSFLFRSSKFLVVLPMGRTQQGSSSKAEKWFAESQLQHCKAEGKGWFRTKTIAW